MKLKPLGDRLIVRAIEEEETTPAGSCFPTPPRRSRRRARSLPQATASWTTTASASRWTSRQGDEVLYSKYGGTEIKVDGEDLLVLRESDVLARVES